MSQVFISPVQNYYNLSTTITSGFQVKIGMGIVVRIVHGIVITGINTLSLYDGSSSSGSLILTMNTSISTAPENIEIGATFSQGLWIVTSGLLAPQLCIIYQ